MKSEKKDKKSSGAKPGMHHGPGSSKLGAQGPWIQDCLNKKIPYRTILRLLKDIHGIDASLSTLQSFIKRRDEDMQLPQRPPRNRPRAANLRRTTEPFVSTTPMGGDVFEAARRQAQLNTTNKAKTKRIDVSKVYV